mmetsp:Transcript_4508/g.14317  ORF Transcript_4508/g.14317 Transcript_4508/m.14317 type:complete len:80 (-) Transcript_4508:51-290(-)
MARRQQPSLHPHVAVRQSVEHGATHHGPQTTHPAVERHGTRQSVSVTRQSVGAHFFEAGLHGASTSRMMDKFFGSATML